MKGEEKISISQSEYDELQNWRKIKPQLASIFHAPRFSTTTTEQDLELSEERDDVKKIYRYIQDNEKINKEKVVQAFEYSRKRVFKCIKILCSLGYVNARKDPVTNRDYILTISKESLLTSLMTEFHEMETIYFTILDKLESIYKDCKKQDELGTAMHINSLIYSMFITLRHTVDEYFYRILLDWPEKTNDAIVLHRGQKIFFSSISKVLTRLQKSISQIGYGPDHARNNTKSGMKLTISPTFLAPHFIRRMLDQAKELHLRDDISLLLDFTWKTVSKTHLLRSWPVDALVRDWREYLSPRFKNYPSERKIFSSF